MYICNIPFTSQTPTIFTTTIVLLIWHVFTLEFKADVAYEVLSANTSMIKESAIDLMYLADKMLEGEIITEEEKRAVIDRSTGRTTDERMDMLLNSLKSTVKFDGATFGWFLQVLEDIGTIEEQKQLLKR